VINMNQFDMREDYEKYEKLKEVLKGSNEITLVELRKQTGLAYPSIMKAVVKYGYKIVKKKIPTYRVMSVVVKE